MLKYINGGVCAAQGFRAAGIHVGVKTHAAWKKDVALIVSDVDCAAAAMFTTNVVKAAPIHVDRKHLADGKARPSWPTAATPMPVLPRGRKTPSRCARRRPRPSAAAGGRAGLFHRRYRPDIEGPGDRRGHAGAV